VELKNECGEVVAVGYEQGIFNITSSEFNVAGELEVCGDAGPLTGKTVDKFYSTGLVWIDDCGAFHAEGRTVYVLCNDSACPKTCPAPDIVLATSHAVFMGEGVS